MTKQLRPVAPSDTITIDDRTGAIEVKKGSITPEHLSALGAADDLINGIARHFGERLDGMVGATVDQRLADLRRLIASEVQRAVEPLNARIADLNAELAGARTELSTLATKDGVVRVVQRHLGDGAAVTYDEDAPATPTGKAGKTGEKAGKTGEKAGEAKGG